MMRIEAINADFVANVSHVDLSETLTHEEVGKIEQAIAHYAVLVFRDQPLTDDQHADFARRFGPIDKGLTKGSKGKRRLKNPDVIDLANVDDEGDVLAAENIRNVSLIANQFWHSDSSFKDPPAKFSILCGIDLPDEGGQTEFADQRAAYDALDDKMKARIDNMVVEHFAFHSRDILGGSHHSQEEIDALPPVHWPMVHTVPESGRKSLFIGIHTRQIEGMPTAEARMLLHELLEQTTQRQFIYRHEWQNHDVIMWDNQCTLHRGRPYNLNSFRELRRCSTEVSGRQVV